MAHRGVLDVIEHPTVVPLRKGLFAAVFYLIKLIAARHALRKAEQRGILSKGGHVFESTSGTMGLALAYACREARYPLTVVGDSSIDEELRRKLEMLDARVVVVDTPQAKGGFQAARLATLHELMSQVRGAYWTRQYENPDIVEAYGAAASTLAAAVQRIDYLVVSVGTGASATGLTRALRAAGHPAHLVAVDTHCSILFGQPDGKRLLRGLGNSLIPQNLDYTLVDECHWIAAAEAFQMTLDLFRTHLLDVGPTSGATYLVARWLARCQPKKNVVFVCADSGERYRRTVYSPGWLASQGLALTRAPSRPRVVEHPSEAAETWSCIRWAGRPLASVVCV